MATTSLYDLFRQSAERFPNNAAVLWCSDTCRLSLSYKEVLKECADIAGAIRDASGGVGGQFVGVLVSSADLCLPSAVLGILREGLAFVFLGPDNLRGDGASVLRRLKVRLVLTNVNAADRDANVASLEGASGWKRGEVATRDDSVEVWELPLSSPSPGDAFPAVGRSLAYAIQTSGTLGEPKTVRVPHSAIVPNILDLGCELQVVPEDVMVLRTPLTFDPSVVELFLPLSRGASIMLVPPGLLNSPSFLLSSPATLLQTMPSLLLRWPPNLNLAGSSLRAVLLGGEPFPPPAILPLGGHHKVRLYNLYGITEVSCWATVHRVDEFDCHPVRLGRPLSGTVLEVRDPGGAAISSGEGEAFIGSSERVCYLDDESDLKGMVFRATGDTVKLWTFKAGGNIFSTPCVWSPPPPGDSCVAADLVAFGCHDGKVYCLSCSSTGGEEKGKEEGSEPKLAWCTPVGSAVFSTPSVAVSDSEGGGGLLAVATTAGELLVLNAGTGSQLCSHRCPGEVFSSPVLYGGSVYVGCRDNNVYCLKVSFDSGRVLYPTVWQSSL